jgi:hypothetical protein
MCVSYINALLNANAHAQQYQKQVKRKRRTRMKALQQEEYQSPEALNYLFLITKAALAAVVPAFAW